MIAVGPFVWREPWRTPEDEWRVEEARQRALKEPVWPMLAAHTTAHTATPEAA